MNVFFYYLPFLPGVMEFYARFQDHESNADWRPEYSWMLSIANMFEMRILIAQSKQFSGWCTIYPLSKMLLTWWFRLTEFWPYYPHLCTEEWVTDYIYWRIGILFQVFTRPLTLLMILSTTFIALIACFVTIGAPGFFVDISYDKFTEKVLERIW